MALTQENTELREQISALVLDVRERGDAAIDGAAESAGRDHAIVLHGSAATPLSTAITS